MKCKFLKLLDKLMLKHRRSLILFGALSGFVLFLSLSGLFLYFRTDVEVLVSHYPKFDLRLNRFVLLKSRPDSWVSLKEVDYYARSAIIVSEDWAFYDHDGFDIEQIKVAVSESIKQGVLVRGASTITQQVVKNIVLSSEKTIWRKFRELILSYKLEKILTKDKILEIYLNIAHLGKNIYGIKLASNYYFHKDPSQLNAREGAFLAMLLPSPVRYSESFKQKKLSNFAENQIENILIKLRQAKIYTEIDRKAVMQTRFHWEPMNLESQEL